MGNARLDFFAADPPGGEPHPFTGFAGALVAGFVFPLGVWTMVTGGNGPVLVGHPATPAAAIPFVVRAMGAGMQWIQRTGAMEGSR